MAEKSLLDINKKLIDIGNNELYTFLRVSNETLLKVDRIERYQMVPDPIGMTYKDNLQVAFADDYFEMLHLMMTS